MTVKAGALLLAAGFSKRFGSSKLLAELPDGQSVFSHTLTRLRQSFSDVLVITRPELTNRLTTTEAEIAAFDQAKCGMGASLAFGIARVQQMEWCSCLVCLADMPFIKTETYTAIGAAAGSNRIVIPFYQDRPGNPVAFGRVFFDELRHLTGDTGGKAVVNRHAKAVIHLAVKDNAVLADIDTPRELQNLQTRYSQV